MYDRQTTAATKAAPAAQSAAPSRLVTRFANRLGVDPGQLLATLKETAFKTPGKGEPATNAQLMALIVVANEYKLNPFTKELYAFPSQGGGIVPIVSIDGWLRIINSRPELDSISFEYPPEGTDKADWWVSCSIKRKDRALPVTIREYYAECYRETDPWRTMGRRMLRHKATIQCARIAFGYGGIYDADEGERIANANAIDATATEIVGKPRTREPVARIAPAQPAAQAAPAAATLDDLRRAIDAVGVPESELLAHFEAGELSEFTPAMIERALEWLQTLNAG